MKNEHRLCICFCFRKDLLIFSLSFYSDCFPILCADFTPYYSNSTAAINTRYQLFINDASNLGDSVWLFRGQFLMILTVVSKPTRVDNLHNLYCSRLASLPMMGLFWTVPIRGSFINDVIIGLLNNQKNTPPTVINYYNLAYPLPPITYVHNITNSLCL